MIVYNIQNIIQNRVENILYIGDGSMSLRKISITVQLSGPDDYEGGDLEYWKGGTIIHTGSKKLGAVFIFPSYMMYRVTPVTKGFAEVLYCGLVENIILKEYS